MIRVTLQGDTASDVDVNALKKWLERERSLEGWVRDDTLRIHERARADDDESVTTMGAGMEILLVLAGAMAPRLFDEVLAATRAGVDAWRENRRSVERGAPPLAVISPHVSTGHDTPDLDGGTSADAAASAPRGATTVSDNGEE